MRKTVPALISALLALASCAPPGYGYAPGEFTPHPLATGPAFIGVDDQSYQSQPPPIVARSAAPSALSDNISLDLHLIGPETVRRIVQDKIQKYCASATSAYCAEYQSEMLHDEVVCGGYRIAAYTAFGLKGSGLPRGAALRSMGQGDFMGMTFADLDLVTGWIYSDGVNRTAEEASLIAYNACPAFGRLTSK